MLEDMEELRLTGGGGLGPLLRLLELLLMDCCVPPPSVKGETKSESVHT